MIATGTLGLLLAITYVASNRVLAPCVVSHFLIDLLIEPGLVLAAVKGEMSGAVVRSRPGDFHSRQLSGSLASMKFATVVALGGSRFSRTATT